ncbi:MAG: hypothetical protein CMP07_00260 [Xanthomonadales bacterium]|nr:hypothetical protein [Xanthomonadales bacterium]
MRDFSTAVLFAEGATSQVYRAIHEPSGRHVAIKTLKSDDPGLVRRFRLEAEALGRLDHPGIARLVEAGIHEGRPFIATEFIDGAPIDRAMAGHSPETVVKVFVKVADALAHAHDNGLLHRDLKPANVLVRRTADGSHEPIIVDFGLAADLAEPVRTETGALLGTPAFMAPEQAQGARARIRRWTDIYGLGAVLYATMAGRPPYDDETAGNLIASILAGPPPRPGRAVPRKVEAIIDCAMARRPERRYGSARRMSADLTAWLDGQPVRATRGFRWRLAGRAMRRHRWATVTVFAFIGVLGLLGVQQVLLDRQAAERQARALALNERLALSRERMRLAHLAPQHDITPALTRLSLEIDALQQLAAAPETQREPAVRLVLGQLLMDADRNEEAVRELRRARQLGCDSDRCAVALALGYLRLYEHELERRLSFSGGRRSAETVDELERARELLGRVGVAGHANLRLAALSGPLDEVARRVDLLVAEQPWQYDAYMALAESRYRAGLEAMRSDQLDQAFELLAAAERDFEAASRIARSLPGAYLGACRAHARQLEIATTGRVEIREALDQVPVGCSAASDVLPGHVASYSVFALVLERLAVRAWRAGAIAQAAEYMGSAFDVLERAPESVLAQPTLRTARARVLTTSVRVEQLGDPEAANRLRDALADARKATAAQPDSTSAWHARAVAVALLSARDVADAEALAREAERTALRVAERWPRLRSVRNLLGNALTNLAYRQRLAAEGGMQVLRRAITVLERLVSDAPDYESARNNLGMAYWELTLQRMAAGDDFTDAEQRAANSFSRVLERAPAHPSAKANLSSLNLSVAERLIDQGIDPDDRLDRSIRLLSQLRAAGDDLACDLALAHWLKARISPQGEARESLRAAARRHAARQRGADCTRVQRALRVSPEP